jgi:hypothetical protein
MPGISSIPAATQAHRHFKPGAFETVMDCADTCVRIFCGRRSLSALRYRSIAEYYSRNIEGPHIQSGSTGNANK